MGFLPKKTLCNDRGWARERNKGQGTSLEKVFEVNVVVFPVWSNGHLAFFMCQAFPIPTFSCRGWNRIFCNALDSNFKGAFWKNVRIKHRDPNAIAGRWGGCVKRRWSEWEVEESEFCFKKNWKNPSNCRLVLFCCCFWAESPINVLFFMGVGWIMWRSRSKGFLRDPLSLTWHPGRFWQLKV